MVRGAQPGLAHEIFLKLLKAKREVPGAAERQKTLPRRTASALCGCGLTAGTCKLDHVVPVRQAFAGSVQTLQALCGDCHSEKTLRESAQPNELGEPRPPALWSTPGAPSCLVWFLRRRRALLSVPVSGPDLGFFYIKI